MKTTKILTLALLASSVVASAAYAGGEQAQKRIAEENAAYFAKQGNTQSNSAPSAKSADYQFNNKPEQRMAVRSQAYFEKIGYKGGEVKPFNYYTDVSQYPFPGSVLSAERGGYVFSSAIKR
jgi:hypothetical protein